MSKAFVKEDSEAPEEAESAGPALPAGGKNYITPEGYARLEAELRQLVEVERPEPVFHSRWEARVFGIVGSLGGQNIDAGRHSIERLDPVAYLANGYFGRWLAALERTLVQAGVVSARSTPA